MVEQMDDIEYIRTLKKELDSLPREKVIVIKEKRERDKSYFYDEVNPTLLR